MAIRTKGRAKFHFRGRLFVWYIENDRYVRIASADKHFAVAYAHGHGQLLKVAGEEFPGLPENLRRPLYLATPTFAFVSMGGLVEEILEWSFDASNEKHAAEETELRQADW